MESSDLELRRLQLDEKIADQDYQLRMKEMDLRRAEIKRARMSSPLMLGVVAALIAAVGNGVVSWVQGTNQLTVEQTKFSNQQESDRRKTEDDRIFQVTKDVNRETAASRTMLLTELGLISDPNRQAELKKWAISAGQNAPKPIEKPTVTDYYESGWLGGGNNQTDQCAIGRAVIAQRHPGKTILLQSSSEQSKKDFLGRVEYKYFCTFEVS